MLVYKPLIYSSLGNYRQYVIKHFGFRGLYKNKIPLVNQGD